MPTGSLVNNLYAGMVNTPAPEVGMGATELCFTDRHPYTIIEVESDGKSFKMQTDHAKRVDNNGQSDAQHYEYTSDPKGSVYEVLWRARCKNPHWQIYHRSVKAWGNDVLVGRREKYHDLSF